jgi:hypothetical protein
MTGRWHDWTVMAGRFGHPPGLRLRGGLGFDGDGAVPAEVAMRTRISGSAHGPISPMLVPEGSLK